MSERLLHQNLSGQQNETKMHRPLLVCATCPGSCAELWRNGPMPFVWKRLGIQTQSVQLWRDAGTDQRPSRDGDRERQRAVGREQRSEKVESTRGTNCVCLGVCMSLTYRLMPTHHLMNDEIVPTLKCQQILHVLSKLRFY